MKLLLVLPLLVSVSLGHILCIDTSNPKPSSELTFCTSYSNSSCCATDTSISSAYSSQIANFNGQYEQCAAVMKSLLCATCDPWGAHLFGVENNEQRIVPFLCSDYCTAVYTACKDAPLDSSNPFQVSTPTIAGTYATDTAFCQVFYGENAGYCYSGSNYEVKVSNVTASDDSICIEKVNDIAYVAMAVPFDNSGRIFAVEQEGRILVLNKTTGQQISTFLDLTDRVWLDGEKGLLSLAFHPDYSQNGLFYIYYSCTQDACPITCQTNDTCTIGTCYNGLCSHKMDPTKPIDCINYVSEFRVNPSDPNTADIASERRLIRIEKPWANHNGGYMSFSQDGMLYIAFGDGGSGGDPELNGQDMTALLGKIVRINPAADTVNNMPYTIPNDNPFFGVADVRQEIYAYGFRNPWRCSFDKTRPSYFICADVGQDVIEEVDLVRKGGNYGWNRWEGTLDYNKNVNASNPIFPVMEYDHSIGHSITGGYFYRGVQDACHCGTYIFADFQDTVYFTGTENPPGSGIFQKNVITTKCSQNDARCAFPGNIFSFGEDEDGEVYVLGRTGLYRTTNPSQCGNPCNCTCMIDGKCLQAGDVNPDNSCQKCDASRPCQWTLTSSTCSTTSTTSGTTSTSTTGETSTTTGTTTGSTSDTVPSSTTSPQNNEESSAAQVMCLWSLVLLAVISVL